MTAMIPNGPLRPVKIRRNFTRYAEGSVLIEQGNTRVLCTASVETKVPEFCKAEGQGWITAEYQMLPRSTHTRGGRGQNSRALEISRLVGRALRSAIDLKEIEGYAITVDCDVLQADGGTRCASITGGMVALVDALRWMRKHGKLRRLPQFTLVAAVSVGIVDGRVVLDLDYEKDSAAEADLNVVMNDAGRYVEVQGTAENGSFTEKQFSSMRALAKAGILELLGHQKRALRIAT